MSISKSISNSQSSTIKYTNEQFDDVQDLSEDDDIKNRQGPEDSVKKRRRRRRRHKNYSNAQTEFYNSSFLANHFQEIKDISERLHKLETSLRKSNVDIQATCSEYVSVSHSTSTQSLRNLEILSLSSQTTTRANDDALVHKTLYELSATLDRLKINAALNQTVTKKKNAKKSNSKNKDDSPCTNKNYSSGYRQRRFINNINSPTTSKSLSQHQTAGSQKQEKTDTEEKKKRSKKNKNTENSENDKEETTFEDYMNIDQVKNGLKNGTLFEGNIRINPRNYKESYVTNPVKEEQDILIEGLRDRNRSLEGDHVVIQINPEEKWRANNQKTGKVVYIKEKVHDRVAIGYLKLMPDKNHQMAAFSPRDTRIPRIRIPYTDWPPSFYHESQKYEKTLFLAKIVEWTDTRYAIGTILERIGEAGDLKIETKAILLENGLDVTPYSPDMNQYFPATSEIPSEEFEYREDLREECIFTIDPLTARDLDDAVSCKELPNGNYEIGVHISDVSFYLKENTPLNEKVSQKATTIYLVESVYHMLPRELCMLCSLLPGDDRLAFSVFWEITPEGNIIKYRFARTIINSCCQLAYEHAQQILDHTNTDYSNFPKIFGGHTIDEIIKTIKVLHNIAIKLRSNRFENGALRISQPKLMFHINPETGLPESFSMYVNQESHRLIEEFMLLANMTVATKLHTEYPDLAFLRCHPPPHGHLMIGLKHNFEKIGIHLDISTAGNLHQSMEKYGGDDVLSQARMVVINAFCAKPMARAKYFCAAFANDMSDYWHYALNVPLYTHFTSPIRRYADVMVHRLLAALLGYTEKLDWVTDEVAESAAICNKQKYNAKKAGEQSAELYLMKYIEMNQPLKEFAVVLDVKEKSFDVIVMSMGINVRIYKNNLSPAVVVAEKKDTGCNSLTLRWPPIETNPDSTELTQVIEIFTLVEVELTVPKTSKIEATLLRPSNLIDLK